MLQYEKLDVSGGTNVNKASLFNVCFSIIGFLKMLDLNLKSMSVINVMICWR